MSHEHAAFSGESTTNKTGSESHYIHPLDIVAGHPDMRKIADLSSQLIHPSQLERNAEARMRNADLYLQQRDRVVALPSVERDRVLIATLTALERTTNSHYYPAVQHTVGGISFFIINFVEAFLKDSRNDTSPRFHGDVLYGIVAPQYRELIALLGLTEKSVP